MPSTRVKAAICRTSSGDCSRTRTLQQAPHPLQLPRSSMVGDPSRTSAARLEEPLEPPPQVVDSVRDPRERPCEERLPVVALAIADHAEGDLARGRGSPQLAPLTSTKPTTSTDVLKRPSERAGSGGSARYVNVVWPPGGI